MVAAAILKNPKSRYLSPCFRPTSSVKELNISLNDNYLLHKNLAYTVCAWIRHTWRCSRHAGVRARRLGTGKSCKR